eukprot:GEMP01102668.1.p1 GENE.GEMP01102668.1~~GEMP01102668.1.p1  ORF type:complete len:195 (+),score=43.96 GEMP01102668.1:71-655(+)
MATVPPPPVTHKKIVKDSEPTKLELQVAEHLSQIEAAPSSDIKHEVADIVLSGVREIEGKGKTALVIFVPFRSLKHVKKVQSKLIRELEKKLEKRHVIFVGNRTILNKNFRRKGVQVRPRTRTLTSVHEAILEDIVGPTEIVGKRTRVCTDGSKLLKVFLNPKDKELTEEKLGTFATVYKTLTNKETAFAYPAY